MPSSRFLIASNTLTGTQASVTFSSIPSTYTDLVLKISARNTGANAAYLTFNGVSTALYSNTDLQGTGSLAQSVRTSSAVRITMNDFFVNTTANTFANNEIYIPSYLVTQNKPVSIVSAAEANATLAYINASAGLFRDTTAISSLTLLTSGFVAGSTFWLYGLKNS